MTYLESEDDTHLNVAVEWRREHRGSSGNRANMTYIRVIAIILINIVVY